MGKLFLRSSSSRGSASYALLALTDGHPRHRIRCGPQLSAPPRAHPHAATEGPLAPPRYALSPPPSVPAISTSLVTKSATATACSLDLSASATVGGGIRRIERGSIADTNVILVIELPSRPPAPLIPDPRRPSPGEPPPVDFASPAPGRAAPPLFCFGPNRHRLGSPATAGFAFSAPGSSCLQ